MKHGQFKYGRCPLTLDMFGDVSGHPENVFVSVNQDESFVVSLVGDAGDGMNVEDYSDPLMQNPHTHDLISCRLWCDVEMLHGTLEELSWEVNHGKHHQDDLKILRQAIAFVVKQLAFLRCSIIH